MSLYRPLCLLVIFLLPGCASKTSLEVAPKDWTYQERAIHIHAVSTSDLNSISGRPHSLVMGVFQLSDPNTFLGLSETKEGALHLLDTGRIDDTVTQFSRLIFQPSEDKTIVLPRAKGTKHVAVISGYFGLNTELDIAMYDIPIKPAKRGIVDLALSGVGLIADEAKAIPDNFYLQVELGRQSTKQFASYTEEELELLDQVEF